MINVKELRIGNLLEVDGFFKPVLEIKWDSGKEYMVNIALEDDLDYCHLNGNDVKLIPLTEEWLDKLGFTKVVYKSTHDDFCDCVCYELENREFFMSYEEDFSMSLFVSKKTHEDELGICPPYENLKYVHSLQNLYYSLTGEELDIASINPEKDK